MDDMEGVLSRLVQVGIVTDVDQKRRKARVKFEADDMTSGELRILASPPFIPKAGAPQQTEAAAGHQHPVTISPWLPNVNDVVLVLFLPADDSDGYILGSI